MPDDFSDYRTEQRVSDSERQGVAEKAGEAAGQAASTTKEQAGEVAAEARRQARDLAFEAKTQVRAEASSQQHRAAERLHGVCDELTAMAEKGGQSGLATELAREASARIHGWADWLETHEPGDLLNEVREFARRRPGLFLLGAAVAGVAAGRLTRGAVAAGNGDTHTEVSTGRPRSPADPSMETAPLDRPTGRAMPPIADPLTGAISHEPVEPRRGERP